MTYMEKSQPQLDTITDYNGSEWSKNQVKAYNRYTDRINCYAGIEIKEGSLTDQARNHSLDQRHRYFVTILELNLINA